MGNAVSLVVDAVAIAAAIPTGGASLTLMEGVAIAGAAVNAIGTVTNNKTLQTIGAVASVGAGIGAMASPEVFNSSISSLINSGAPVADLAAPTAADLAGTVSGSQAAADATLQASPAGDIAAAADPTAGAAGSAAADSTAGAAGSTIETPAQVAASNNADLLSQSEAPPQSLSTDAQKGWLAKMSGLGDNTTAALIKTGAGVVGGIMDNIAPSPTVKSNIKLQGAQTAGLQQQQGILAARNTVATPNGTTTAAAAAPNSAYSGPATGYGPTVGNGGAAMGYAPQVAQPGILSANMQPQTNPQGLTLNSQGQIV